MFEFLDQQARKAIYYARIEARDSGFSAIEPAHLLLGVVRADPALFRALTDSWSAPGRIRRTIRKGISPTVVKTAQLETVGLSPSALKIIEAAQEEAKRYGLDKVGTKALFQSWLTFASRIEDEKLPLTNGLDVALRSLAIAVLR